MKRVDASIATLARLDVGIDITYAFWRDEAWLRCDQDGDGNVSGVGREKTDHHTKQE